MTLGLGAVVLVWWTRMRSATIQPQGENGGRAGGNVGVSVLRDSLEIEMRLNL